MTTLYFDNTWASQFCFIWTYLSLLEHEGVDVMDSYEVKHRTPLWSGYIHREARDVIRDDEIVTT